MDKKLKQKWIEALRSGKYKQARSRLKARNGAMCCLGVLCDIQGKEWVWVPDDRSYKGTYSTSDPLINRHLRQIDRFHLAEMNDGDTGIPQHSFSEIADYIEKNL